MERITSHNNHPFRVVNIIIFLGLILFYTCTTFSQIRIMPLGDSITRGVHGSSDSTGYRRALYHLLSLAGLNIDFVGSQADGTPTDFDRNHEGHSGWTANQIRDNISNWLTATPADIVLLHIGTNDITGYQSAAGVVAEVGQILDKIDNKSTAIIVFLARIINRNDNRSAVTTQYNLLLQSLADTRIANGDLIVVVNQEAALNYPADLSDAVHPNDNGYEKMAQIWAASLLDYFGPVAIQLYSLNCEIINQSDIKLEWITITETDNYGFEIDRTILDSFQSNWKRIGFVRGFGTCNTPQKYYFIDHNLLPGGYRYRIKQINNDGSFLYYGNNSVQIPSPETFILEQNYPNPFNSITKITFSLPSTQYVTLNLYDILGNEVGILINEIKKAGKYEISLDPGNLSSGVYLYHLQAGLFGKTKKLTILK